VNFLDRAPEAEAEEVDEEPVEDSGGEAVEEPLAAVA
jgi:hypothetical protein